MMGLYSYTVSLNEGMPMFDDYTQPYDYGTPCHFDYTPCHYEDPMA